MAYHSVREFLEEFRMESALTKSVFAALTDDRLSFRPRADGFSLGELAWHLTESWTRVAPQLRIPLKELSPPELMTTAGLTSRYDLLTQMFAESIHEHLRDETLAEMREVYGYQWSVAQTLSIMIHHEVHHRGQLILAMKLAGLTPPKVYG